MKSENIYKDAKKGELAQESELLEIFKTKNTFEIATEILEKGSIDLTSEYRKQLQENKLKKIIEYIHMNSVDPGTKLPHPAVRIENAMEEAKVRIDDFKTAENQINEIVKKMTTILPIRFERRTLHIRIPPEFAGRGHSLVSKFGNIIDDNWMNDGSWVCNIDIPAGLQEDLIDQLNGATKGSVEIKIIDDKR